MSNTVLVTDSLYIHEEHIQALQQVGLNVVRLDKSAVTEDDLIANLPGKIGYILGGTEKVTPAAIAAADELKAIVMVGDAWEAAIPGYAQATQKGILIADTPGANAYPVAEYTLSLILMMLRRVLELGSTGDGRNVTTGSVVDARVGIIGMGRVGELVARMLLALGASDVVYYSRQARADLQTELGISFMPLEELIATADVITTHLPEDAGELLTEPLLKTTKPGVVLINTGAQATYNKNGLYDLLIDQKARAAFDFSIDDQRFEELTADTWFYSNTQTGYNTYEAAKTASDMATQSLLNLLTTGQDDYRVN